MFFHVFKRQTEPFILNAPWTTVIIIIINIGHQITLKERLMGSVHKRSDELPLSPEVGMSVSGLLPHRAKCQCLQDVFKICQK